MNTDTEKMLLEYVETGIESHILYAIKNENVTKIVLERAIDFSKTESVLLKILDAAEKKGLDIDLFRKIFEAEKQIISLSHINSVKLRIIQNDLFTKDMYDYYISMINELCYSTKIMELLINSKYSNEESYIKILKNITYNQNNIMKLMVSSRYITEKVLEEIVKTKPQSEELICNCITNQKITSKVLNSILDIITTENPFLLVLESPILTEENLIKAISIMDKVYQYASATKIAQITNKILSNEKITEKILLEIINNFSNNTMVKELVSKHHLATKNIKIAIIINSTSISTQQIEEFFQIDTLTENDVISLVNKHPKNNEILEKAIEFSNATQKLYKTIISMLYVTNTNNQRNTMTNESKNQLIKQLLTKELEENTLLEILNQRNNNIDIIKEVINHHNANLKVVAKINILCDSYRNEERNQLLSMANELKRKIIAKMYQIEQEENVTEILRMNVEDRMSTMLWGPSGVGKSSRVFEIDPTATMLILKNGMLPEEVIGGKEPNGEPGQIYPPHWYKILCEKCSREPKRMHILFIDEFTNVSDTIKNLVWEVIGNRLVNGHEEWILPENCAIVVAGNRPEESSAVRIDSIGGVMPAPLHNRVDSMLEIKFDIDEWQKWALETDPNTGNLRIHPIVYSFCVANADKVMFTKFNPEEITQPFLTPRKWETLSKALYSVEKRGKNRHISDARIMSVLGTSEISNAFIAHYERLPIDMNKIVNGEYTEEDFPTIEDKLYALGMVIAEYNGDEIAIESFIIECLGDEYLSIYNNMKSLRNSVLEDEIQSQNAR